MKTPTKRSLNTARNLFLICEKGTLLSSVANSCMLLTLESVVLFAGSKNLYLLSSSLTVMVLPLCSMLYMLRRKAHRYAKRIVGLGFFHLN
jgi:hypothetical protein